MIVRNPTCKHNSLTVVMLILTPPCTKKSGRGHALHDQADVHITRLARLGLTKKFSKGRSLESQADAPASCGAAS